MPDLAYKELLRWALPKLGLRELGFRNVDSQVVKRIKRRVAELGLHDAAAYRARLEAEPDEWRVLDALCVVTISRFYRDAATWDALRVEVLPAIGALARGGALRAWSVGCASGEEPYTLALLWALELGARVGLSIRILATDVEEHVLDRARAAIYPSASLVELPASWREQGFDREDDHYRARAAIRDLVTLRAADVRRELPDDPQHLILCRNVVCTYFGDALQRTVLARLRACLVPGGAFVIGKGEQLPSNAGFEPWRPELGIFRRPAGRPARPVVRTWSGGPRVCQSK